MKIRERGHGRMKLRKLTLSVMMLIGVLGVSGYTTSTSVAQSETSNIPIASTSPVRLEIFIAASLKNAMEEIQTNYKENHPEVELIFNADSSGTLQTQIEEGATCHVFFSAAMKPMNALEEEGYVMDGSTVLLLENQLVLIKPKGVETKVTGFRNIAEARNIALANEDVPVGAYARELFSNLKVLDQVMAMEINEGSNVTAVLAAVGEASNEIGVVYATDAYSALDRIEIIETAPEGSLEEPIVYPVGIIKDEGADEAVLEASEAFIRYLSSDEAIKIFESYGFSHYKQ